MAKIEFKVGRPCNLNQEEAKRILAFVPRGLIVGQVARLSKIPKRTLSSWLKRGEDEINIEPRSIFVQFLLEFEYLRGIEIAQMLEEMRRRVPGWQALWEILKSIAREDFGVEAVEYKELLDLFTKLSESFKRFTDNQGQGVTNG